MNIKEAIILAGGLGTRLRSAVPDLPKCMAPVNGKPFLHYVISYFQQQGIERFIFSLGYKHDVIEEYLEAEYPHSDFQFAIEEEPLGTGGAIKMACKKINGGQAVVVNGDTFFKVQLKKMSSLHSGNNADCTMALKPMKQFERYGVVELNSDSSVASFKEKKWYDEGLINGGVYILNVKAFLQKDLPDKFSFEKDYLEKYYQRGMIYGIVQDEYFIDIGIPEDYERANKELREEGRQINRETN
jgi:D-glycero-alpha-D-manno-heptose 1-phosphate guanylyltransferase